MLFVFRYECTQMIVFGCCCKSNDFIYKNGTNKDIYDLRVKWEE